jgi:hypothetical protein
MEKYQLSIPLPVSGINLIDDSNISDSEAAEGTKNISFKDFIPQTRKGYIKDNGYNFTTKPNTIYNYIKGVDRYLLAACGSVLKRLNGGTFSEILGVLNSDNISCLTYSFKFADPDVYGEKCFILDGENYRYYDGVNETLKDVTAYVPNTDEVSAYGSNVLSTAPDEVKKQRFILNDDERIWVAGYGKLVRISHLQHPDYFPSTQVWKLDEDCTAMARFMDEVFLFTANGVTLISGSTPNWNLPDKYIFKRLPGGYGCAAHRSIVQGDNSLYWANKDGVYRYRYLPSGFSIPECVSEFLTETGHRVSVKKWLSGITDWSKVHAQFYDHEYRLYIGNRQVIVYDTIGGTWALYEYDKEFNCSAIYDKKLFYAADYIYAMDYTYNPDGIGFDGLSDDGAPIQFILKSKFFDFDKAANKKRFKKLYFSLYSELVSYNINLLINLDNEYQSVPGEIVNKVSRWGTFAFGDRLTTKRTNLNYPISIHHKGKKYNIQYELVCNGLNMAFSIKDIVILMKVKELK